MFAISQSFMDIARSRLGSLGDNLALLREIATRISWLALTLLASPFALVNGFGNRVISGLERIFGEGALWISRSLKRWQEDPSGEAGIPKKFFTLVLRSALLFPLLTLDLARATGNALVSQVFPNPAWPPEEASPAIRFALQAIGHAANSHPIHRSLGGHGKRFPWDIYHCVSVLIVAKLVEDPQESEHPFAKFLSGDHNNALNNLRETRDRTRILAIVRQCPSPDAVQAMKGDAGFYVKKIYDLGDALRSQRPFQQLVFPGH